MVNNTDLWDDFDLNKYRSNFTFKQVYLSGGQFWSRWDNILFFSLISCKVVMYIYANGD